MLYDRAVKDSRSSRASAIWICCMSFGERVIREAVETAEFESAE